LDGCARRPLEAVAARFEGMAAVAVGGATTGGAGGRASDAGGLGFIGAQPAPSAVVAEGIGSGDAEGGGMRKTTGSGAPRDDRREREREGR
jgi:hypothetical protein